jgi:DNA-directed RNA polymerase specialized sigma24 family protein
MRLTGVDVVGTTTPVALMRRRSKLIGPTRDTAADPEAVGAEARARTPRQAQHRLTREEVDALVAAYLSGLTLDELAASFAVDSLTAAKHLELRRVARRGRKLSEEQVAEAIALYQAGWSLTQLGERFGIYPQSIAYRLKRAGVLLRPRPGWTRKD